MQTKWFVKLSLYIPKSEKKSRVNVVVMGDAASRMACFWGKYNEHIKYDCIFNRILKDSVALKCKHDTKRIKATTRKHNLFLTDGY